MANYFRFDWLSCMISNSTLHEIMEILNLADFCSDFLSNVHDRDQNCQTTTVLSFSGVTFEVNTDLLHNSKPKNDLPSVQKNIFYFELRRFRLDISGSGLDFLRSNNFDVTNFILSIPKRNGFTVTRLDWAYDFVNYDHDFTDMMIRELNSLKFSGIIDEKSRLKNYGSDNGQINAYKYQIFDGTEKSCLYIGANRSQRLARIYNKYLERLNNGVFTKDLPIFENDPCVKSWVRFEMQTRYDFSGSFLKSIVSQLDKGKDFIKSAWAFICEKYMIVNELTLEPLAGFKEMFTSVERAPIILNEKYTYVPIKDKLDNTITRVTTTLAIFYIVWGMDLLENKIYDKVHWLLFDNSISASRARIVLAHKIEQLCYEEGISIKDFAHPEILSALSFGR